MFEYQRVCYEIDEYLHNRKSLPIYFEVSSRRLHWIMWYCVWYMIEWIFSDSMNQFKWQIKLVLSYLLFTEDYIIKAFNRIASTKSILKCFCEWTNRVNAGKFRSRSYRNWKINNTLQNIALWEIPAPQYWCINI